ncbi:MAG: DUF3306 domain-containing protein [Burkholderiales bacterium]
MAADRDHFLRRWSRRKLDAGAQAPKPAAGDPAPKLPSLDSLTFESDFKDFMHTKVEESVKRAALKTLFTDPRFNVIDFMDVYIDDYTNLETIPPEMLARLEHSRSTLFGRGEAKKQDEAKDETETRPEALAQAPAPDADPEPHTEEQKKDDGAAG